MNTSQKIMTIISVLIFSVMAIFIVIRDYALIPYYNNLELFSLGLVFFLCFGSLFAVLNTSKVAVEVYYTCFAISIFLVVSGSFVLLLNDNIKYSSVRSKYSDMNERLLKANPDVIYLSEYAIFKENMDTLNIPALKQEANRENDLTSVDLFKVKLIDMLMTKSNNVKLNALYAKIMSDKFFSVNEYNAFKLATAELPDGELKSMLIDIDRRIVKIY